MSAGDFMHSFSPVPLLVGHHPQNGRQNHPRSMNPGQGFMQADGPARSRAGHSGREDRKVSGREIETRCHRAQRSVQIAAAGAGGLAAGLAASDDGGEQRYSRY